MKFICIIFLFLSLTSYSQKTSFDINSEVGRTASLVSVSNITSGDDVDGTPYYQENYTLGEVFKDGVLQGKSLLKYNGYSDNIEFLRGETPYNIFKNDGLSVIIKNLNFKLYDINGEKKFYITFNKGKTSLLLNAKKKFKEKVLPKSSYDKGQTARFISSYQYYFLNKEGKLIPLKLKKKNILTALKDKKEDIINYVSKNKLKYKKEKDVIKIIDFYNSL